MFGWHSEGRVKCEGLQQIALISALTPLQTEGSMETG